MQHHTLGPKITKSKVLHESIFALSDYKNHWSLTNIHTRRVHHRLKQPNSNNHTDQRLVLLTDKCLASPPGHTPSSDGNNKSVPVIHISQPNVIKVYGNSQVRSQLTLVHQAVCMGLYLVPLVGGCGVGVSGLVAG